MSSELQRYGRGPEGFPYLLTALPDGYWTPWHVADQQLRRLQNRVDELEAGQAVGEAEDLRREVAQLQAKADRLQGLLNAAAKIVDELARPSGI